MGENAINGLISVALAIVGVAIIAVLVSNNANTAGVLTSAGSALSTGISAAVSPVTGSSNSLIGGAPINSVGI